MSGSPAGAVASDGELDDVLELMFAFTGQRLPGRSSLKQMAAALQLLGDPQQQLSVIHVTGTCGKTSTCYAIRALLEQAGWRTGLTVSPHISGVNERVQIDGQALDADRFRDELMAMLAILEPMRGQLTYFELVCCLALWEFARQGVDYAIVEVGIGGRRDATNICQRPDKVSVIGPIGLDHTDKLGESLAEIAMQKAGIIVPGGLVFVAAQDPIAMAVIDAEVAQLAAQVIKVVPAEIAQATPRLEPVVMRANWAMAQAVVAALAERDGWQADRTSRLAASIDNWSPPGRFEVFDIAGQQVVLDGAHNPAKLAALVEVGRQEAWGPVPVLATLLQAPETKLAASLAALEPLVGQLLATQFHFGHDAKSKQSFPADQVAGVAAGLGMRTSVVTDPLQGLRQLLATGAPRVLVTGSLYLVSAVRPWLLRAASRA
ncbi:MAG: hypothetical protein LBV30_03550 [Propionibacteriaceae bacterium]|jgi:dihydrofolate synthase/folylpolyglutamate synthase|nr:hypothetical protein [Propionibacteriaceae bacterium]